MGAPYLGEVRSFAFNFDPTGWMDCGGQLLPIQRYPALFSLLGTTYGGNGETDFALPKIPPLEATDPQQGLNWRICVVSDNMPPRS